MTMQMQVWQTEIAAQAAANRAWFTTVDQEAKLAEAQRLVAHANERVDMLRSMLEDSRSDVRQAKANHEADIAHLSSALLDEAESRQWCSDFDEFVDTVNRKLHVELPTREREMTVRVAIYLDVDVRARDEDAAIEIAETQVRAIERFADGRTGTTSSIGDYEVTED